VTARVVTLRLLVRLGLVARLTRRSTPGDVAMPSSARWWWLLMAIRIAVVRVSRAKWPFRPAALVRRSGRGILAVHCRYKTAGGVEQGRVLICWRFRIACALDITQMLPRRYVGP
jgi:hypothetical protein